MAVDAFLLSSRSIFFLGMRCAGCAVSCARWSVSYETRLCVPFPPLPEGLWETTRHPRVSHVAFMSVHLTASPDWSWGGKEGWFQGLEVGRKTSSRQPGCTCRTERVVWGSANPIQRLCSDATDGKHGSPFRVLLVFSMLTGWRPPRLPRSL
jgi:hypothetical protein